MMCYKYIMNVYKSYQFEMNMGGTLSGISFGMAYLFS